MRNMAVLPIAIALLACASAPAVEPATPTSSVSVAPADLHGYWAEYWAPGGHLRTQRHLFLPDGRWGWACEGGCGEPTRRSGRWSLEAGVVRIEAAGTSEQLSVDACPPNDEASAMDAEYKCFALGGRVFWWQAGPESGDPETFVAP